MNKQNTCCFFDHRKINVSDKLVKCLKKEIEQLIFGKSVNTFLFGSKSEFDALCLSVVTELKRKYPYIIRIYVRAEYPFINDDYKEYLLKSYDDTYYPERIMNAGRAVYVERNCEMIDNSSYAIIYYDKNNKRKSGTKTAADYAEKKDITIINVFKKNKPKTTNYPLLSAV